MRLARAVDAFLRHITIERGLSAHTVAAYRRDLAGYLDWLASHDVEDTDAVTTELVTRFASERAASDPPPASTSLARLQSAVRSFHRFLAREGIATEDPTSRLRPPKAPMRLPKALPVDDVIRLLDAAGPAPEDAAPGELIGLRDRALLELLYATGARVSEIVDLDVDDLRHGEVLRVRGKGSKERVVPVGSYARASVDAYLTRARPELSRRGRATLAPR